MTDNLFTQTDTVPAPALEGVFHLRTRNDLKVFAFKAAAFVFFVWTFAAFVK